MSFKLMRWESVVDKRERGDPVIETIIRECKNVIIKEAPIPSKKQGRLILYLFSNMNRKMVLK